MTDTSHPPLFADTDLERREKARLRFSAQPPIGRVAPPLPVELLVRVCALIVLMVVAGTILARDGAPGLAKNGHRIVIAHADSETRSPMRRTMALADRISVPMAPSAASNRRRASKARTFTLGWEQQRGDSARLRHTREDVSIITASLGSDHDAAPARPTAPMRSPVSGAPPAGQVEQVLSAVKVVDARTLAQGDFTIRLEGIDLPTPTDLCILLNGMSEPCSKRMATQLELMTRWRQVVCIYSRPDPSAPAQETHVGQCRVGNTDLAKRLTQVVRKAPSTHTFQSPIHAASL